MDKMRHYIQPLVKAGACVEDIELVLRCGPIEADDKISNLTSVDHQDKRTGAETFTAVRDASVSGGSRRPDAH